MPSDATSGEEAIRWQHLNAARAHIRDAEACFASADGRDTEGERKSVLAMAHALIALGVPHE